MSPICADLDAEVAAFRDRSLFATAFPCVFLNATSCKARVVRRVAALAVVIATGVAADGTGRCSASPSATCEDGAFWTAFLRSLEARGLAGAQLVIPDAHTVLKQAIAAVLLGAAWQRCQVHFSAVRAGPGTQGQRGDGRRRDSHDPRPARRPCIDCRPHCSPV